MGDQWWGGPCSLVGDNLATTLSTGTSSLASDADQMVWYKRTSRPCFNPVLMPLCTRAYCSIHIVHICAIYMCTIITASALRTEASRTMEGPSRPNLHISICGNSLRSGKSCGSVALDGQRCRCLCTYVVPEEHCRMLAASGTPLNTDIRCLPRRLSASLWKPREE
jgi:hypothetical protein